MKDDFKLDDNKRMLMLEDWTQYGIVAGFTTRMNGVSKSPFDQLNMGLHVKDHPAAVLTNRKLLSDEIGVGLPNWRCINQVHGDLIIDLTENHVNEELLVHDSPKIDADGMLSNNQGDFLVTFYADCVPLFVIDTKNKYIGLAHAGWKGTVQQIGRHLVHRLLKKDSRLEDIRVAIGPSISQANYEINETVAEQIPHAYHREVLEPTSPGHYLLDLKTLNERFFIDAGIKRTHIIKSELCTYEQDELFYSYRRDQGNTGRMAAFIGLS